MNRNRMIAFTNQNTADVFAATPYMEFSQLMFDTAKHQEKVATDAANDKIREVMFQILGITPDAPRKELRRAIRRHKIDVYEVAETTLEDLLVSGWGENPFFNEWVEIKSGDNGDTNEFYTADDVILTVSELSGNHHNLLRQRLGAGKSFRVKTSWYGVKI